MQYPNNWKAVAGKAVAGLALTVMLAGRAHAAPFDQQFIDSMVPHHQSALIMAQMAARKAPHAEVRSLARRMVKEQQREITQLKAWRKAWYGSAEVPTDMMRGGAAGGSSMGGMDHGSMNHGSMSHGSMSHGSTPGMSMSGGKMTMPCMMMGLPMKMEMDMGRLMRLHGRAFEKEFLRMMVPHHAGAIMMGQEALNVTARRELRGMSRKIIDSQAKEIGEMQRLHRRWYGLM